VSALGRRTMVKTNIEKIGGLVDVSSMTPY